MLAESEEIFEGRGCGNSAEVMVEMYLKEAVLSHLEHIHPLTYWKKKKLLRPCLAGLTCKYLSISIFCCV